MGSSGFLARAQLRRRWRALAALTVLVGVIGGLAIALIAGARRSASVVERYFAAGIPYDLEVSGTSLTRDELLDLPEVVRADPSAYVAMVRVAPDGTVVDGINGIVADWSSIDPTIRVLDGAVPDGTDPFEVVVNEAFVESATTAPSATPSTCSMFGLDQRAQVEAGDYRPTGPALHLPDRGRCPDAHRHRRRRGQVDQRIGVRRHQRDGRLATVLRGAP